MSEQIHQLVVRRGPKQGHIYELHLPIVNVGRDPMSDINLNDPEVSRQHARLIRAGDGYQLQDLNSTNGTYLNGKKVENKVVDLQPGQEVMMGSGVVLFYQVIAEDEPAPPTPEDPPILSEEDDEEAVESDRPETVASDFKFPQAAASPPPVLAKSPPLPDLRQSAPPKPPPPVSPQVVMPEGNNGRRNQTLAIAIVLILLCSCCAFLIFMYQWGGDWLLQQLGLLP